MTTTSELWLGLHRHVILECHLVVQPMPHVLEIRKPRGIRDFKRHRGLGINMGGVELNMEHGACVMQVMVPGLQ